MEILTNDKYRVLIGAKRPEIDPKIEALITAANAHITAYLNISDKTKEYLRVFPNRATYFLKNTNATAIKSIKARGADDSTEFDYPYFLDEVGTLVFDGNIPPAGVYEIEFEASNFEISEDLVQAAFLLVSYWDKEDFRDSRTFGGETTAFTSQATGMPKHIRTILELHRNI